MLFKNLTEIIDRKPHCAAMNMAIDEALLRSAEGPLIRVYHWVRPAVSFGYFERFADLRVDTDLELVRRWTGGGVVSHGQDITYSLLIPSNEKIAKLNVVESYRIIHQEIASLLSGNGLVADLAQETSARVSTGCFENPAEADVLVAGTKVAGAAQRRTRWGLLHQGSIQGAELPRHLGGRLGELFTENLEQQVLSGEILGEAEKIAGERYATEAWLRRF